jgi:hypothetical protein
MATAHADGGPLVNALNKLSAEQVEGVILVAIVFVFWLGWHAIEAWRDKR